MRRTFLCAAALIGIGACDDPMRPGDSDSPAEPGSSGLPIAANLSGEHGFRARDLGTLGGPFALAIGLNERTQAVGWSTISPDGMQIHPYLWTPGRGMRDLGTLGGDNGIAFEVNQRADVVGFSDIAGNVATRAFLWTEERGMRDLRTLGGANSSAQGINNRRQVVGDAETANGRTLPFIWQPGQGMRRLNINPLGGPGSEGRATSINETGEVAGYVALEGLVDPQTSPARAFRWTPGRGIQDIGTLGGDLSQAWGINDRGDVVGLSSDATGASQAFLWTERRGMQGLGTLGGAYGNALSINASRVVVGESLNENGGLFPFVWTKGSGMRQLPIAGVGGVGGAAVGINEKNEIAGLVFTADGGLRAVLWRPRGDLPDDLLAAYADPAGEFEVAAARAQPTLYASWCKLGRAYSAGLRPGIGTRRTCPTR
jgi:probable HAF family extracellular repeat protein